MASNEPIVIGFTLNLPVATDVVPVFQVPRYFKIKKVTATVKGGTSFTFNLEKRAAASLASAGTDIMTSDLAATTTGASTTTLSLANLSVGDFIVFVATSKVGDPDWIHVLIEFQP